MEESTNKNFGELTEELERINNLDKQLVNYSVVGGTENWLPKQTCLVLKIHPLLTEIFGSFWTFEILISCR